MSGSGKATSPCGNVQSRSAGSNFQRPMIERAERFGHGSHGSIPDRTRTLFPTKHTKYTKGFGNGTGPNLEAFVCLVIFVVTQALDQIRVHRRHPWLNLMGGFGP